MEGRIICSELKHCVIVSRRIYGELYGLYKLYRFLVGLYVASQAIA